MQSSLLVEVGPLNNDCAAFVGRFTNYVCVFLDSLVATTLPLKIGKFGVTIKFFMKKAKNANWPFGGFH